MGTILGFADGVSTDYMITFVLQDGRWVIAELQSSDAGS